MHSLAAEIRITETGKSVARKLRNQGRIPAVVYGSGHEALSLDLDPDELVEIFRTTGDRNTIIHLDFADRDVPAPIVQAWTESGALTADRKLPCMVKDVQRHPLSRNIEHVDFYWLAPGHEVVTMVPLKSVGRAAGMSIGGRLRLIRRELKIRCAWESIPESITYDITPMNIGDIVKASELYLPEGVSIVARNDFNVMTIYGRRVTTKAAPAAKKKK